MAYYDWLAGVEKPARYTGNELNMVKKQGAQINFALCFPDTYEVGMSHLGSRILYHVLNEREDTFAQRVYAPWPDMESELRKRGLPLTSLESATPLNEFDIIGFSLTQEMCYTNVLNMLELGGIPALAKEREGMPLVVCGGPCVSNMEPLAPFIDAAMYGDGEEVIGELVEVALRCKREGLDKAQTLKQLAGLEGVYVPAFYEPRYDNAGDFCGMDKLEPCAPEFVNRRIVKDLDAAQFPTKLLLPYINIVHDRVTLEIFRGCTRGCRFCQAGYIYRPVRERRPETLLRQARELVDCTGYDEISLLSLSSGDYPGLDKLIRDLTDAFSEDKISVSLPSLRIDSFLDKHAQELEKARRTGLTFAPEAGTQRLRDVINKGVGAQDLLNSVSAAFEAGWNSVKLYFMIGLPTETDEDLLGIAELAREVSELFYARPKEERPRKGLNLVISTSNFVPKPATPFQWAAQASMEELKRRQLVLKSALKGIRGVHFKYNDPGASALEAAFARGDRRLAGVLLKAREKGCRFDSWNEHFNFKAWLEAFEECGLTLEEYTRERALDESLPWDITQSLISKKYLERELALAYEGKVTPDCRAGCTGCFGKENYASYCKV